MLIAIYFTFSIILIFSKAIYLLRVRNQLKLFIKHLKKMKKNDEQSIKSYEKLLNQRPKLQEIGLYQYDIGYSNSYNANLHTIEKLPGKLKDVKNFAKHSLLTSFYPSSVFKFTFGLPSKFIQSLGLSPIKHKEIYNSLVLLFNLTIWIIVYLLNLFSPEIKELILSNLQIHQ